MSNRQRNDRVELRTMTEEIRSCMAVLLHARTCAEELERNPWDFAVEIAELKETGATLTHLRWLVCKEWVQHACETTGPSDECRLFRDKGGLTFAKRSAFILTSAGVDAALSFVSGADNSMDDVFGATFPSRDRLSDRDVQSSLGVLLPSPEGEHDVSGGESVKPTWDSERRELRLGDAVVKVFRLPSPNQETVLTAFEEDAWPPCIDDPLPPTPNIAPKQRLHDTIKSLNRNQKRRLIRFAGDGTGEGVCWEVTSNCDGQHRRRKSSAKV